MSKMLKNLKEVVKTYKVAWIWFLVISVLLAVIDQITKWIAVSQLGPLTSKVISGTDLPSQNGNSVTVISGFLKFTLLTNNGAAFGVGGNMLWSRILFIIISWVVFFVLPLYVAYHVNKQGKFSKVAIAVSALIYGGNLGNLIDRTFYWGTPCGVIDFIDISPLIPGFGVFNFADSALVVGIFIIVILLIIDIFKGDDDKKEVKTEETKVESSEVKENVQEIKQEEVSSNEVKLENENNNCK